MQHLAKACLTVLLITCATTSAVAQEPIEDSNIAEIEQNARTGIAELNSELTKLLEELIRVATKESEFDRLATLAKERQQWLEAAQLPQSEATRTSLKSHFAAREELLKNISEQFESEIQRLTKLRRFRDATSVRERMQDRLSTIRTPKKESTADTVKSDDPTVQAAITAHESFLSRYSQTIQKIEDTLKQELETAIADGHLSKVEARRAELIQLKDGLPIESASSITQRRVQSEISRLRSQLKTRNRMLENAIEKAGEKNETALANQLTAWLLNLNFQRLQRWNILFRSTDSRVWNSRSNQWDAWARSCSTAPENTRFLKLTRTDTDDFVIIPMAVNELTKVVDRSPIRWGGDKYVRAKVHHLGISRLDFRPNQKGYVVIGANGFTGYTGWGFGHRHNIDDGIWCAWNGIPIKPVIMEIAVTTDDLTSSERRRLLIKTE